MGNDPETTFEHWATEDFGIRGVPTVVLFDGDSTVDIKARTLVPFVKEVQDA